MATRPQTNLDLNQVSLQPTVRGAGRNQVFAAPLPRLTQAQVLAKNLAQFSTVLGQFSNVQQQRAEIDALTKVSNEEVKAQMAGAEGKEMGLLDKIGYEKKYNETLYSRGFELTVKPLFSKLSSDIEKQGVERLADRGLFDEYINSGLENIDQQIRENIKDKPFMADIHNAMWSKASADFYTQESETYDKRRDAYLTDATFDVFTRNFPDPIPNDEQATFTQMQTYFDSFDKVFQSQGISNSKIKSLFIDMTSSRIEALAMDERHNEARLLIDTLQKTKVNKTPLFNDKVTSLKIEKLQRFVNDEEDRMLAKNSKLNNKVVENIFDTEIRPKLRTIKPQDPQAVFNVFPGIDVVPETDFVNPKIRELGRIRNLDDGELAKTYQRLAGNPKLIEDFREYLNDEKIRLSQQEEADIEGLTQDSNVGIALKAVMPDEVSLGDFENEEGFKKYNPLITKFLREIDDPLSVDYIFNDPEIYQTRRKLFAEANQKFDSEMRSKARELVFEDDDNLGDSGRENFLKEYAPKIAERLQQETKNKFIEYLNEQQKLKIDSANQTNQSQLNPRLTPEEQQDIAIGSTTEEQLIENKDRELLARKDTFPNDGNNKPDVSIESNFGIADNNETLLGGLFDVNYEQSDLDNYNTKFNNVRKEGLFRDDKEKVDEFFTNLKIIRSKIDYAPSYLKTIREGTVAAPTIGFGFGGSGDPNATLEASGDLIIERRRQMGRLILTSGLTEEEARQGIASFEGDDVGYPVDNLIRVSYDKMPILTLNTIANFNDNIIDAVNTVEEIIKKNDMRVTPREFVDAQEKIINAYTLPEQE